MTTTFVLVNTHTEQVLETGEFDDLGEATWHMKGEGKYDEDPCEIYYEVLSLDEWEDRKNRPPEPWRSPFTRDEEGE